MNNLRSHRTSLGPGHRLASCAMQLAAIALLAACAPDAAVSRADDTGFNGFVRTLGAVCKPLLIGDRDVGEMLRLEGVGGNQDGYDYFLDISSKLYYNRISFAAYRENLTGFFGAGTANDASFACIQRNLPAQRPSSPY